MAYRQELKYLITGADRALLLRRLNAAMLPDPYSTPDGTYFVRTLYFDDVYDSAMQDAVSGAPYREKIRLRMYNGDAGFLRLEKKIKNGAGGKKPEARLTPDECRSLIAGDYAFLAGRDEPLLRECYAKARAGGMQARTVVDYTRAAFGTSQGNVRVTVDSDIRVSRSPAAFFEDRRIGTPVMENGECVLEVKFDRFLPDYIPHLLSVSDRTRTAMSKFAAGRIYY